MLDPLITFDAMTCTLSRFKCVRCDACATDYFYVMRRVGRASLITQCLTESAKHAQQDATTRAMNDLREKMDLEEDLAPCPNCKWVNQHLIDGYLRSRYHFKLSEHLVISLALQCLMLAVSTILLIRIHDNIGLSHPDALAWIILSVCPSIPGLPWLAFWGCIKFLKRRVRPNRHWPQGQPVLPNKTPQCYLSTHENTERLIAEGKVAPVEIKRVPAL